MKIRLKPEKIIHIHPDEDCEEYDTGDLLFCIKILKAGLEYGNNIIEVPEINSYGQIRIPDYNIWISDYYYDLIEE